MANDRQKARNRGKSWERDVARLTGGTRRGPDFRGPGGGKDDVIHPHFSIECKNQKQLNYKAILEACRQAEVNAPDEKEPVCIIKPPGVRWQDALVCQRLPVWKDWRLGEPEPYDHAPERVDDRLLEALCSKCGHANWHHGDGCCSGDGMRVSRGGTTSMVCRCPRPIPEGTEGNKRED